MIEQNLSVETPLLSETEQLREEKIAARRKKRKRYVKRCRCRECGQPKHYICLEHHPRRKTGIKKLLHQIRYQSKKLLFNLAEGLGLIE